MLYELGNLSNLFRNELQLPRSKLRGIRRLSGGTGMQVAASRRLFWIPAFARMTETQQAAGYWSHFE
jgi:hypothetical protein